LRAGLFREDLFYGSTIPAEGAAAARAPPNDILPLADHISERRKLRLSPAAERLLRAYEWPGNVRELRNALDRAAILANGSLILPGDLPPQHPARDRLAGADQRARGRHGKRSGGAPCWKPWRNGGNKTRAAALLGISRRT
jgi:DNA-binding NtrC family response regulator